MLKNLLLSALVSCFTGLLQAQNCAAPFTNAAANLVEFCDTTGFDTYAMVISASSDSTVSFVGVYRELTPVEGDIDCNTMTFTIAPQHLFTTYYVTGLGGISGTTVAISYSVFRELDSSLVETCNGTYEGTAVGVTMPVFEGLFVYPNPASQSVMVRLDDHQVAGEWSYSLKDLQGRSLLDGRLDPQLQATIDLRPVAKGVYLVQLHNDAGAAMYRRLVVR